MHQRLGPRLTGPLTNPLTNPLTFPLIALLLCAGALAHAADAVQFHPATFVQPPAALDGDPGDGRCPDPSQPCLKDNEDLLSGRTHLLRSDDLALVTRGIGAQYAALTLATSANSVVTAGSPRGLVHNPQRPAPMVVGARMFNTPTDVAVTLAYASDGTLIWRFDDQSGEPAWGTLAMGNTGDIMVAMATDLTNDGLDELVVWVRQLFGPNAGGSAAVVATAANKSDPKQGLRFGPVVADPIVPRALAEATVAGQPRLLLAGHAPTSGGCTYGRDGLLLNAYTVDPNSLAISGAGSWQPLPAADAGLCLTIVDLTAGRLGSPVHDQLALLYAGETSSIKVLPLDLDTSGTPTPKAVFDTGLPSGGVSSGNAQIESAHFDAAAPLDQAALLVSNCFGCNGINTLRILTFDDALNVTVGPVANAVADQTCDGPLVIGNFDRQQTNANPPPATFADPTLQIAVPFNNCSNTTYLRLFDVAPANNFTITSNGGIDLPDIPIGMAALDLQGRSLRVGPPDIVTLTGRQQATLVLASPPMHVDAVIPITGGAQRPFNITGAPDGFSAGYSFSSSNDTKTDTTNNLSWSFSAKETLEEKLIAGDCEVGDCQNLGFKASAKQALKHSTDTLTGNFSTTAQTVSLTTGFSDLVSTLSETLTIYVYPAIGRQVCPSTIPACTDAEKVPLTVNLAGPDTVVFREGVPGVDLTWYQPVWMPGHLLSYPGSLAQLQRAAFADPTAFEALSEADAWTVGGGGTASKQVNWTGGGSAGSTTSYKQNYSFELDLSGGATIGLGGVFTAEAQASLDLSGSVGFSSLTNTLKTLSATQGITLTRTASFLADPIYDYQVTPHIFGKRQPATVVDDNTTPADVQTFGALRTGHEVAPVGGYWQAWYGRAPDLALNQPAHWTVSLSGSDLGNDACLTIGAGTSDYNCVKPGDRLPAALGDPIWLSAYHWLRGFFVSGPSGGGPQYGSATSGDDLLLQVRVYNLSLAPLNPGDTLHVRFMAMPWDSGNSGPAGPSFLIGEQQLTGAQLPPAFSTTSNYPNWVMVGQPFDTSGTRCGGSPCDNLDLVFWVVVWAADANGNLLTELPQHGLASPPAPGEDFLAVAGREQAWSNNLGFYNQVFHVFPRTAGAPAALPAWNQPTALVPEGVGAIIALAGASAREVRRGDSLALALKVDTGPSALTGGLEAVFYDGDPAAGAPPIGRQRLPHLHADSRYDFRVLYRPKVCGRRSVHAVVGEGTRHAHSVTLDPIDVRCDDLGRLSARLTAKGGTLGARQWTVAVANSGAATARAAVLDGLRLTQIGGAACRPVVTSPLPVPLGDIPRGEVRAGTLTIDFTGCAPIARFRAELAFSSNDGLVPGALTLNNQFR